MLADLQQMVQSITRRSHPPVLCDLDGSIGASRPTVAALVCVSGPSGKEARHLQAPAETVLGGHAPPPHGGKRSPPAGAPPYLELPEFRYDGVTITARAQPEPEFPNFWGLAYSPGRDLQDAQNAFHERVREGLREAKKHVGGQPKIVVASELAFPVGTGTGPDAEFVERLRGLCKKQRALLIGGSFHDVHDSWFNLVPVIAPEGSGYRRHPKQNSATKVGERVRTPAGGRLQVYVWRGMTVVPIVCLDAYDGSLVVSIAAENFDRRRRPLAPFDLVVVPSMNDDDVANAANLCKGISELSRSSTLLVDGTGAGEGGHSYFRHGSPQQEAYRSPDERISVYVWNPRSWYLEAQQRMEDMVTQLPWRAFRRGSVVTPLRPEIWMRDSGEAA